MLTFKPCASKYKNVINVISHSLTEMKPNVMRADNAVVQKFMPAMMLT